MRPHQAVLLAATAITIAVTAAFVLYSDRGSKKYGAAAIGGPFTLSDQSGRSLTEKDLKGSYSLIYFGYTFCPDVCPTGLQVMSNAMDQLQTEMQRKIKPVFITIDPERDTVDQLKSYLGNFHPRIIGLTGTERQIAEVTRAYRVYYAKAKGSEGKRDYLMDHSSIIFLMNPEGKYVNHFTHMTAADNLAATLRLNIGN